MLRVHIICEGPTEETFIKDLLVPHFLSMQIYLSPTLIGKVGHKGGTIKFERLFTDVRNRLLGDTSAYCTTFFDFYALPSNFPGRAEAARKLSIREKSECINAGVKRKIEGEIGSTAVLRYIPYVQMYEFEALLFSDCKAFAKGINDAGLFTNFQRIRDDFSSPEEINDSPITAPSKRVLSLVSSYEKPLFGTLAALEIGLTKIRQECVLFNTWLKQLEDLAS